MPRRPSRRIAAERNALGRKAEDMACRYLQEQGFELLGRNQRVGRLEIDVVARRGALICFCEVRSRRSDAWMSPAQSIDRHKVRRLREAAYHWLRATHTAGFQVRFDVASVLFDVSEGRLTYLEGAF